MRGVFKSAVYFLPMFMIAACGGSGDSSSGSGGGTNPYAGTYTGNAKACVSGGGQTACEEGPSFITINADGTLSSGPEFTGKMDGNTFTARLAGDLPVNDMVCKANMTGSGVVNGNTTTGSVKGPITCSNGANLTGTLSWNMSKSSAQAFNVGYPSMRDAASAVLTEVF